MFTESSSSAIGIRTKGQGPGGVCRHYQLGLLFFFKYYDFFAVNLSRIPGVSIAPLGLTAPIGISFYTFQAMSYTIDVYRRDARGPEKSGRLRYPT